MQEKFSNKIPVIYILSNSRSGSTLLDLLLGAHPQIWTVGEAINLPFLLATNRKPCGCGIPLRCCAFWKDILPLLPLGKGRYPIGYFRDQYFHKNKLRSRQLRLDLFWTLITGFLRRQCQQADGLALAEFGRNNAEYFRIVWRAAQQHQGDEIRWLVDASKNPHRLFWLQKSGHFSFRVIHLVKDPRGFVTSLTRPNYPRGLVYRSARRWAFNSMISVLLCRTQFEKKQVLQVRYEELASRTEFVMERIGKWLGIEDLSNAHERFRNYTNHAVSGNPMRWENTGLYLDERWKTELPRLDAAVVHLLTWPFRLVFRF
jgi:hypothetical protein